MMLNKYFTFLANQEYSIMHMVKKNLQYFLSVSERGQSKRNRTVNIKNETHEFYRTVSSHYNVALSTIISNILEYWKDEFEDEIKQEIVKKFQE